MATNLPVSIDAASIMSKWLGEAEKNVSKLFTEARKLLDKGDPVIIFIDELDSILGSRTNEVGGETRVRNQFLKEMDGIRGQGERRAPLHGGGHEQAVVSRLAVPAQVPEAHLHPSPELRREDVDVQELHRAHQRRPGDKPGGPLEDLRRATRAPTSGTSARAGSCGW